MNEVEKMTMKTPDGTATSIAALKNLFPEIVTEGKVDFDALKTILGGEVAGDERYQFTWAGKRAAMIEAAKPITKTLRPCPEQSKNWDSTQNIYIEGDNLDALKILQATYAGKVKMIYIDPPYNTGKDFIYHDNFHGTKQDEQIKEGTVDAETGLRFKANTESNGYFHSDWCSMMYPRLKLARQLLREDGVIFISIDENEVVNLKKLCDEIFGEKNFVNEFCWVNNLKGRQISSYGAATTFEYVLCYAKQTSSVNEFVGKVENLRSMMPSAYRAKEYEIRTDAKGTYVIKNELYNTNSSFNEETRPTLVFQIFYNPETGDVKTGALNEMCPTGYISIHPHANADGSHEYHAWRWSAEKILLEKDDLEFVKDGESYKVYTKVRDYQKMTIKNLITDISTGDITGLFGKKVFDFVKPEALIDLLLTCGGDDNGLVVDFFAGSSTTAHAVMEYNAKNKARIKFLMVQLPEETKKKSVAAKAGYKNICEIGEKRIDLAGEKIKAENATVAQDLDIGFRVFKVDSSNVEDLYHAPKDVRQSDLLDVVSNVKPGRKPIDLLYGCLVDWGLPIDLPHETKTINGHEVFSVGGGVLMACFDQNVDDATVKAIAAEKPSHALFRDTSFVSSAAKINVGEIFKALSPETKIRVL